MATCKTIFKGIVFESKTNERRNRAAGLRLAK